MIVGSRSDSGQSVLQRCYRRFFDLAHAQGLVAAIGACVGPVSEYNLQRNKYDRFVPTPLLREAYSADYLDIPGAVESILRL